MLCRAEVDDIRIPSMFGHQLVSSLYWRQIYPVADQLLKVAGGINHPTGKRTQPPLPPEILLSLTLLDH